MHSEDHTTPTSGRFVGVVLAIALFALPGIAAADIAKQRELFKDVYETVERGDWSPVDGLSASERKLLEQYVLWPDLRATWLRANLKTVATAEVNERGASARTVNAAADRLRRDFEWKYPDGSSFPNNGHLHITDP